MSTKRSVQKFILSLAQFYKPNCVQYRPKSSSSPIKSSSKDEGIEYEKFRAETENKLNTTASDVSSIKAQLEKLQVCLLNDSGISEKRSTDSVNLSELKKTWEDLKIAYHAGDDISDKISSIDKILNSGTPRTVTPDSECSRKRSGSKLKQFFEQKFFNSSSSSSSKTIFKSKSQALQNDLVINISVH